MLDAFKQLVESGVMSEQIRSEVESAFTAKIQENRDQVTAELREEFAQKYAHDKGVIIESIDKMLSERLAAEMAELAEDKRALAETQTRYVQKMSSDAKIMEAFVAQQLAKEMVEFQSDRKNVSENFNKLEQFVVNALAREIAEFAEDKRDLAETKVKLVAGAKVKFDEVKAQFIKRAAKTVQETVEKTLRGEIAQLREDIDSARTDSFGRRIFEAFAQEFQHSHLNEKSATARLLKIVDKKEAEIAEAKTALAKTHELAESAKRQLRVQKDIMERAKVMGELLAPLSADKKRIMSDLLESVQTPKLAGAFDKYLPAVMEGETRKTKVNSVLSESTQVTGDRKVRKSEVGLDNILDIRKLAGLK
jgi:citrate lyase gamma subunit